VVPLIAYQRYYGVVTARIRCGDGVVTVRVPPLHGSSMPSRAQIARSARMPPVATLEQNLEFGFAQPVKPPRKLKAGLAEQLESFAEFGKTTQLLQTVATSFSGEKLAVPTYVNEFWTSKQRAASSLHEVSYRACFKPQLPRFFIERLTKPGEVVYDPFMGRGTTLVEAALLGRVPCGCDINPLSVVLTKPRLHPPELEGVLRRLGEVDFCAAGDLPEDLLVFY